MNNKKIMPKIIASSLVLALGTINAVPALAYSKDETVYSKVKSNGESYQTTVTEHIKNTDDLETLNDISELYFNFCAGLGLNRFILNAFTARFK